MLRDINKFSRGVVFKVGLCLFQFLTPFVQNAGANCPEDLHKILGIPPKIVRMTHFRKDSLKTLKWARLYLEMAAYSERAIENSTEPQHYRNEAAKYLRELKENLAQPSDVWPLVTHKNEIELSKLSQYIARTADTLDPEFSKTQRLEMFNKFITSSFHLAEETLENPIQLGYIALGKLEFLLNNPKLPKINQSLEQIFKPYLKDPERIQALQKLIHANGLSNLRIFATRIKTNEALHNVKIQFHAVYSRFTCLNHCDVEPQIEPLNRIIENIHNLFLGLNSMSSKNFYYEAHFHTTKPLTQELNSRFEEATGGWELHFLE